MRSSVSLLLLLLALPVGCRGWVSDEPPVHLNPNMDTQEKLKAYRASELFADGRSMRTPPAGTVARTVRGDSVNDQDYLELDRHMYSGITGGSVVNEPPPGLVVDEALLARGRERYDIYCAPCHARHGDGEGLVAARLTIKPPTFHDDLRQRQPLGHFFRVATHGAPVPEKRASPDGYNMPPYSTQLDVRERWAVALYIRALQRLTKGGPLPEPTPMTVGDVDTATEATP